LEEIQVMLKFVMLYSGWVKEFWLAFKTLHVEIFDE
jgi:hypothetical protein